METRHNNKNNNNNNGNNDSQDCQHNRRIVDFIAAPFHCGLPPQRPPPTHTIYHTHSPTISPPIRCDWRWTIRKARKARERASELEEMLRKKVKICPRPKIMRFSHALRSRGGGGRWGARSRHLRVIVVWQRELNSARQPFPQRTGPPLRGLCGLWIVARALLYFSFLFCRN